MRPLPLLALALAAPALAGCLGASGPASLPADLPALAVGEAVRIDAEQPAREPAIVQAPDGAIFVAGFWGFGRHTERPGTLQNIAQGPLVWKSEDGGSTWRRFEPGLPADGAWSNSDLDLAVAPDGTLYMAALTYYSPPSAPGVPVPALPADPATTLTVSVGVTEDGGATWRWTRLDEGGARSHPWVQVDPEGTAHVVWGDGMGVRHVASADKGATWRDEPRVVDDGEAGGFGAAPDGTLAVRVAPIGARDPARADGVAVRAPGGSWQFRAVPGDRSGDDAPHGFDPVAYDAANILYFAWNEGRAIHVAASRDHGATWGPHAVIAEPEGSVPYYPYVRGGAAGQAVVSWFTSTDDVVAARLAVLAGADRGAPAVREATAEADTGGTNHADYWQVAFLRDGSVGAPVPVTTSDLGQWFDFRVVR